MPQFIRQGNELVVQLTAGEIQQFINASKEDREQLKQYYIALIKDEKARLREGAVEAVRFDLCAYQQHPEYRGQMFFLFHDLHQIQLACVEQQKPMFIVPDYLMRMLCLAEVNQNDPMLKWFLEESFHFVIHFPPNPDVMHPRVDHFFKNIKGQQIMSLLKTMTQFLQGRQSAEAGSPLQQFFKDPLFDSHVLEMIFKLINVKSEAETLGGYQQRMMELAAQLQGQQEQRRQEAVEEAYKPKSPHKQRQRILIGDVRALIASLREDEELKVNLQDEDRAAGMTREEPPAAAAAAAAPVHMLSEEERAKDDDDEDDYTLTPRSP